MNLEITVCHSILDYCLTNLNYFDKENQAKKILDEIRSRQLVLHEDLEYEYEQFFENHKPELLDTYREFMKNTVAYAETSKILSSYQQRSDTQVLNDAYLKMLADICLSTNDKILFSDLFNVFSNRLKNWGIAHYNRRNVTNKNNNTILNQYRLPLIRKVIRSGESSHNLSRWLSRFLISETDITIVDGYIFENSINFHRYFLTHIPFGAKIKLFTLRNGRTDREIIRKFTYPPFDKWQFEINIIPSKKDQHARDVFTNNYYIEIDKGMGVFGSKGKTHQANITVESLDGVYDQRLPNNCQKII